MLFKKVGRLLEGFTSVDLVLPNAYLDFPITSCRPVNKLQQRCISFASTYSDDIASAICQADGCLLFLAREYRNRIPGMKNILIFCDNPRYEYAKALTTILEDEPPKAPFGHNQVASYVQLGEGTIVEPGAILFDDVTIGKNCLIKAGAIIRSNVTIGDFSVICENAVIGSDGFGMEKDPDGNNFRIPHVGGVIIEDHVEVGAFSVVCAGTMDPTQVRSYAKIDDHVHVGHNCYVGKNVMLTCGVVLGGSTVCENNSWFGLNSTTREGIVIGRNTMIGMGSLVAKSVPADERVVPLLSKTRAERLAERQKNESP